MESVSRIPKLTEVSFDGAFLWFSELNCDGLLFHPEDDPDTIYSITGSQKSFTDAEVAELRFVLDELETGIGHDSLVEAAYPIFMNTMGIQLDG